MKMPEEAVMVQTPWNDMISLTTGENRGLGIMLESVVEAQNETNRLLAVLINDLRGREW